MNKLKSDVLSFLNIGLNPLIVGMYDDGLYYLYEELLHGQTIANAYDPNYTFVHISLGYLKDVSAQEIEKELNHELQHDAYPGDSVLETLENGVETVCVVDDFTFLEPEKIVEIIGAIDSLIKRFRQKLHVVYVIQDLLLFQELKELVPANSSFFDALTYVKLNESWSEEQLIDRFANQFNKKLNQQEIEQITKQASTHFGSYQRLYKDKVLGTESAKDYAKKFVEQFDIATRTAIRKYTNGESSEIDGEQMESIEIFEKVGFLKDGEITIPSFREAFKNDVIEKDISFDEINDRIEGFDINIFNSQEQKFLKMLFRRLDTEFDTVSKEELAQIIWGDNYIDKYSEWAIDQRISRLRKKIIKNRFKIDVATVYGKGYKLIINR